MDRPASAEVLTKFPTNIRSTILYIAGIKSEIAAGMEYFKIIFFFQFITSLLFY